MVLYLIGLGLFDERDITLRGLDAVRGCARVYLEAYTSILLCDTSRLEELYGKEVVVADREMVENEADKILEGADEVDVAFLVVGDPFGATTHTDLQLRAREHGIPVRVIHNASVMNAIGACGLQLYRFGEAVSIVFFTDTWRPGAAWLRRRLRRRALGEAWRGGGGDRSCRRARCYLYLSKRPAWQPLLAPPAADSFYDKIAANRKLGLHTLCLLDIKARGRGPLQQPRGTKHPARAARERAAYGSPIRARAPR
jgi:diphthine synthase